jgi:uncharacterized protein (DUF302 family)
MAYYFSRKLAMPFEQAVASTTEALKQQGFGIVTTINLQEVLKQKINVDFRNYRILGACNPKFAHQAVGIEPHIGIMLPCNVVVQEHEDGQVEVSAINPLETMDKNVANGRLTEVAKEVSHRLQAAIADIA